MLLNQSTEWKDWSGSAACKAGALPAELHAHSRSTIHSQHFRPFQNPFRIFMTTAPNTPLSRRDIRHFIGQAVELLVSLPFHFQPNGSGRVSGWLRFPRLGPASHVKPGLMNIHFSNSPCSSLSSAFTISRLPHNNDSEGIAWVIRFSI
jgi:hypothetical protein